MTEEQAKEKLSFHFIGTLASFSGYSLNKPEFDFGIDFKLTRTKNLIIHQEIRMIEDSSFIPIQLKATTEKNVVNETDSLRYDLEVKNYNDLVEWRSTTTPLLLILFILPDEKPKWIACDEDELLIRKNAFWYIPSDKDDFSGNKRTQRITIPKYNQLNINTFSKLFETLY